MEKSEKAEIRTVQKKTVDAPVEQGHKVGKIYYILNGKIIRHFDIIIEECIQERTYMPCLGFLLKRLIL